MSFRSNKLHSYTNHSAVVRFWAAKYQTEKVNLIYDKYGYKLIHNDGIAMMSQAYERTRIAIQSDKIFVRFFTRFVGNLWDIVEDKTGALAHCAHK